MLSITTKKTAYQFLIFKLKIMYYQLSRLGMCVIKQKGFRSQFAGSSKFLANNNHVFDKKFVIKDNVQEEEEIPVQRAKPGNANALGFVGRRKRGRGVQGDGGVQFHLRVPGLDLFENDRIETGHGNQFRREVREGRHSPGGEWIVTVRRLRILCVVCAFCVNMDFD